MPVAIISIAAVCVALGTPLNVSQASRHVSFGASFLLTRLETNTEQTLEKGVERSHALGENSTTRGRIEAPTAFFAYACFRAD